MNSPEFPNRLVTNTETKSVVLDNKLANTLPNVGEAFDEVDRAFTDDPEKYLANLEDSMFSFKSSEGSNVACSLLHNEQSNGEELLVLFAPFADRDPTTSSEKLHNYITTEYAGGLIGLRDKEKAAPNTWNQTTKSAVTFELLKALDRNIPVLTIYSPIDPAAYSKSERDLIKAGDFSPAGRIAEEAINQAQIRIHGYRSETEFDGIHLAGSSLGASNAIGAGADLLEIDKEVLTVTAQELILGPVNRRDLFNKFAVKSLTGDPSVELSSAHNPQIAEPALRREIDKHGSEVVGMNGRMVKAMLSQTYMKGLTKSAPTIEAIETLLDSNVDLLVALADNSAVSSKTWSYLPNKGEKVIKLSAQSGEKLGHIANEHVALSGIVTALNVTRNK